MKRHLGDAHSDWPPGVDPHAPVLPYVQDLDVDAQAMIDETLRAFAGVGILEADLALYNGVQAALEFHAHRNGTHDRSEINKTPLSEFADQFTDFERGMTDLFLRKHGGVSFDDADVGLYFAVAEIVEFDAARRRRVLRNTHGPAMRGNG